MDITETLNDTKLEAIHNAANDFLLLKDGDVIDYILSAALSNRFRGCDPIWTFIIAPPSSAKTELLSALDGCMGMVFAETITDKALASGWRVKRGDDDDQPADPSLLNTWNGHVVICKEFTGILKMRHDRRAGVLSILRQAHDGRVDASWGTGAELHWKGKFGLIAAVTPEIYRHTAVLAELGERFLYYRIPPADGFSTAFTAHENAGNKAISRTVLAGAVRRYLDGFPDALDMPQGVCNGYDSVLSALAVLVAVLRTPVHRRRDGVIDEQPEPEGAGRLVSQLTTLAAGIALVRDLDVIGDAEYQLLMKAATDSVPRVRTDAFRVFARTLDDGHTVADVARRLQMPNSTIKYVCEDLQAIGALRGDGGYYVVTDETANWVMHSSYC